MQFCDTVEKCPLPSVPYGSFKNFKISVSDHTSMHRGMCTDEFLAKLTEGVVHGVKKVVI